MNEWIAQVEARFAVHCEARWHTLSRFVNTLIILNVSLFFLTQLVITHGYYYTFYSVALLIGCQLLILQPFVRLDRLWLYALANAMMGGSMYFLVYSIWYWVKSSGKMP